MESMAKWRCWNNSGLRQRHQECPRWDGPGGPDREHTAPPSRAERHRQNADRQYNTSTPSYHHAGASASRGHAVSSANECSWSPDAARRHADCLPRLLALRCVYDAKRQHAVRPTEAPDQRGCGCRPLFSKHPPQNIQDGSQWTRRHRPHWSCITAVLRSGGSAPSSRPDNR